MQELFTLYTRLSSSVNNILFLIFWYVRVQSNTILYSSCFNILYVCTEFNVSFYVIRNLCTLLPVSLDCPVLIAPLIFFIAFIGISVKMHVFFFYDCILFYCCPSVCSCLFVHPYIGYMLCQPYSFQSRNFILQDICTYTKFKFL